MESTKDRLLWVDVLKGILILLVVFGHALQGIASDFSLVAESTGDYEAILTTKYIVYDFHMPVLFIISGLFAGTFHQRKVGTEVARRANRLLRPYFIWSFIIACVMEVAHRYTNYGLGLDDFLMSPIVPFGEFWYLYVLFFFQLSHLVLCAVMGEKGHLCLLVVGVVLYVIKPIEPEFWFSKHLCRYLMWYMSGQYALRLALRHKDPDARIFGVVLAAFAVITTLTAMCDIVFVRALPVLWDGLKVPVAAVLLYEVSLYLQSNNGMLTRALSWFGRHSMPIYVVHLIPVAGTRILLTHVLDNHVLWLAVAASTLVGILASVLVYVVLRKMKLDTYVF